MPFPEMDGRRRLWRSSRRRVVRILILMPIRRRLGWRTKLPCTRRKHALLDNYSKKVMKKFGPDLINKHYYEFNTICDATQVRQDTVDEICNMHYDPSQLDLDFIIVVGGFDPSNTTHLLEISQMRGVPSYHINEASCIHVDNMIQHCTVSGEVVEGDVLLKIGEDVNMGIKDDKLRICITSGTSTPDKEVQDALGRIIMLNKLYNSPSTSVTV